MITGTMHWTKQAERASQWGMAFLVALMKITGPGFIKLLVLPVAGYYFLFSPRAREASIEYFTRLRATQEATGVITNFSRQPLAWAVFRQMLSFSMSLVDRVYYWNEGKGQLQYDIENQALMNEVMDKDGKQGILVLVAHIGNFDLGMAGVSIRSKKTFNIIMEKQHARIYNQFRKDMFHAKNIRFLNPKEINPIGIVSLIDRVSNGEAVAIAADRTPSAGDKNNVVVNFLGKPAEFPSGPYIIAQTLGVPVYCLFAFKKNNKCFVKFSSFEERVNIPRKKRQDILQKYAQKFATRIEEECFEFPFQWYNFYSFWDMPEN